MRICTCCPNPRVTCDLRNAIEIQSDVVVSDAEGGSLEVRGSELEDRGLLYLGGFWHTPQLERIEGVYTIPQKHF